MRLSHFASLLLLTLAVVPGTPPAAARQRPVPAAVDLHSAVPMDALIAHLAAKRVVFVGEIHDRYDHHLNQLEIIRRLHDLDPTIAIGVEYFQQPFQQRVDDYIAGRISESEFLRGTEYFTRWGYDYRLYAPIFRYAREQRIPVRALNVPNALVSAVAKSGIAGLAAGQRAYLPREIEPADEGYQARLRAAFEAHPGMTPEAFHHFVEAQLVWDEGMAESAAAYLNANPGRRMVILAGAGHLEFGAGIPSRLARRTGTSYSIVLSSGEDVEPRMADDLLLSATAELPPAGSLGVTLRDANGECRIVSVSPGSAAEKSGLKKEDVLLALDAQPVKRVTDTRLVLWDKKPGDRIRVQVRRKRRFRSPSEPEFDITLSAQPKPPAMR